MDIQTAKIDEIHPYELNNRKHSDLQIERIAKSISEFGFNQPLVLDENHCVIVGHGRLLAAKKLGIEEVPVIVLSNLTDEQKRAYRILDNKLQNDGEWDIDNLRVELQKLSEANFDLQGYGLDEFQTALESEQASIQKSNYTRKIEAPIYKPMGDCPDVAEIFDELKTSLLIADIESAKIDEKLKHFLKLAAYRHVAIDFEKTAELYAHATKEVQKLMEASALVIIDFDSAIEKGFVEMSMSLSKLCAIDESQDY